MNNLIKTNNNDIKVTYTKRGSYYYDVTISGNIKGKTFGYSMYGSNSNNGGISSGWENGVVNLVNCTCTGAWRKQETNSSSGFNAWIGGGLNSPLIMQA